MKKKFFILIFLWFISLLITIGWTFENPEKISKFKDFIKYNLSLGEVFSNTKKTIAEKSSSFNKKNETNIVDSAYNFLELSYLTLPVYSSYGGIAQIDNNILYLSGDGDLFLIQENNQKEKKFIIQKIDSPKIDNKKKSFIKNNEINVGKNAEKYFGIKDIIIERFSNFERELLIASSLEYNESADCYTIGVYLSKILDDKKVNISEWQNIFSTKNCLSVELTKNPKFAAASAGGRIAKFDDNHILLTIGDFYADGVNGPSLSQDKSNLYGKIIKINIKDLSYNIYSYGHRNPQGLYVDQNNNIFATEHGPTGGDELNRIVEDQNYGWPIATFGTNYKSSDAYIKDANDTKKEWPIDITNNTHEKFLKPIFSWGNQLGISNLIVYENDYFSKWKNNLIVSTLATKQLVRFVYDFENDSVIYKENIKIGNRIRDILTLKNGKIVLLTDRGKKLGENPKIILISKKN